MSNLTKNHLNFPDTDFDYPTFSFWFNGVITLILLMISQCGNVAIIISLICRSKHWLSLYFYFFTFAFWNTVLSTSTTFLYCVPALIVDWAFGNIFVVFRFYSYPLANISMTATFWLVVAVTLERYWAISQPLNHRVSHKILRAKLTAALICILAPLYNSPLFFDLTLITGDSNSTETQIEMTSLRKNFDYQIYYRGVGNLLFVSAIPLCVVFVLNIKIICILTRKKCSRQRPRSRSNSFRSRAESQNQKSQNPARRGEKRSLSISNSNASSISSAAGKTSNNLLLTLITLKFGLCHTLPVIINVIEIVLGKLDSQEESLMYRISVDVSNFFVVLDSATNALLYFSWRQRISARRLSKNGMVNRMAVTPVMVSLLTAHINPDTRKYLSPKISTCSTGSTSAYKA